MTTTQERTITSRFTVFEAKHARRRSGLPSVRTRWQSTGNGYWGFKVSLSQAAYAALGEPRRVTLLYDPDNRKAALRAAHEDDANTCALHPKTYSFTSTAFGRELRVRPGKFPAHMEGDLLVFDLGPEAEETR